MPKRMLIDASHPEETRVVVLDGNKVEEFDFEAASRRPLKGNIYLAKVTRVEPSLQAAFVEYGGNRQGFLAFSEIHPDYYQIPVADRIALLAAQTQRMMAEDEDGFDSIDTGSAPRQDPMLGSEDGGAEPAREESERSEVDDEDEQDEEPVSAAEDAASERGEERSEIASAEIDNEAATPSDAEPAGNEDSERAESEAPVATEFQSEQVESRPSETVSGETAQPELETSVVQAEATGAPSSYERRGPRHENRPRPRRRQYKIQEVIKRRQIILVQVVKEERGTKGASLTTFLSLAGRYCVLMPNTPRGGGISRKITSATDRKRLKSAAQSLELPEGMGLIIRTAGANRTKLEIKRDYEYLLRLWDTVRELTLKSNAPALVYEEGSLIKRAIRDLYNKDISEVQVDGEAGYRDAKDFMRMLMPSHAKNVKLYKEALPLFQRFQVEAQLDAMFSPTVTLRSGGYIVINQTEALVSIDVNSGKATREHSIEETAHKTNLEAADEIARQLRLRDLAGLIVIDFIDMEDGKNDRNVEKRLHNAVRGDRARIQIGKISQFGLLEMSRQRLRAGVVAGSTVTCPHCAGLGIIRSTESAALRLLRALDEEGQHAPAANLTVKAPEDVAIYTLNHKRREIARIEEAYDLGISFEPQAAMAGGNFEIERTGARIPSARPRTAVSVEAGFATAAEPEQVQPPEPDITVVEAPMEATHEEEHAAPADGTGDGDGSRRRRRRRRRGGRGRDGRDGQQPHHETHAHGGHSQHPPMQETERHAEGASGAQDFESEEAQEPSTTSGTEDAAASAPGQQNQPGEGGKRRRRRRGRRGRHRGEMGGNGSGAPEHHTQHEHVSAENSGDSEDRFAPPPVRIDDAAIPVVVPNAESSPQWSLADRTMEEAPATVEPVTKPRHAEVSEPAMGEVTQFRKPEPDVRQVHTEAVAEPPREARKGWWQRRFKLGGSDD